MVGDSHFWDALEIDIAEDTAHAEHVLILNIRAVAPAEDLNSKCVLAWTHKVGEVEFCHIV